MPAQSENAKIARRAIGHLMACEVLGWELAAVARAWVEPLPRQASATDLPARIEEATARRRPQSPLARLGHPTAATQPVQQEARTPPVTGGERDAPARLSQSRPTVLPTAAEAKARVSNLARCVEEDPRPASRQEIDAWRKVGTPDMVIAAMGAHAETWSDLADQIDAMLNLLDHRHVLQMSSRDLTSISELRNAATTRAAALRGDAQALTRDLDSVRLDLMKTYSLPTQDHWDELIDKGHVCAVSAPLALSADIPNTLFDVQLTATPLAGQERPPPSVWLHLHTHEPAEASHLITMASNDFAAMHLKSDLDRLRGRNWLLKQKDLGLPIEKIHRAQVDKDFVGKVLSVSRKLQGQMQGATSG